MRLRVSRDHQACCRPPPPLGHARPSELRRPMCPKARGQRYRCFRGNAEDVAHSRREKGMFGVGLLRVGSGGQLRSLVFGGKKEGAEKVRTLGPWSCTGDVYSSCAPSSPSSSILALESDHASMSTHAFASNSSRRHHDLSLIRPRGNDNAVIVECFGSRMMGSAPAPAPQCYRVHRRGIGIIN